MTNHLNLSISFVTSSIILFIVLGFVQYVPVTLDIILRGDVVMWTLGRSLMEESGYIKYLKDIFLVAYGVYWPVKLTFTTSNATAILAMKAYFIWLFLVFIFGVVGFFLDLSPLFFLLAGVRWLLLLHVAFGFFILALVSGTHIREDNLIFNVLLFTLSVNVLLIFFQLRLVGIEHGLSIGSSRLTGVFSNAGLAGFFSVSVALLSVVYLDISQNKKTLLLFLCLIVALASGTRFAMICVFLCFSFVLFDILKARLDRKLLIVIFVFALPFATVIFYSTMIDVVGRGDIFETSLASGGRIDNFIRYSSILLHAEPVEFFFGRGLGIGTNTAFSLVNAVGGLPESYRFNWLVDNTLLTVFFQLGLIGSIVFWTGVLSVFILSYFICSSKVSKYFKLLIAIFILSLFTSNLFEQYYLIITYMFVLGVICNKSRRLFDQNNNDVSNTNT